MRDGIRTIEKHPTTAAKAHKNSVAASTENTDTLPNASFTVSAEMLGCVVRFPSSMISILRMDGECLYSIAALAFCSASAKSAAKIEPFERREGSTEVRAWNSIVPPSSLSRSCEVARSQRSAQENSSSSGFCKSWCCREAHGCTGALRL